MWQQVELALSQSAHRVLVKLAIFLPALVALLLALVVLTAIGAGLAALLRRFLTAAKFDERLARNSIAPISDWSPANSPTALISPAVFWGCVLIGSFISSAAPPPAPAPAPLASNHPRPLNHGAMSKNFLSVRYACLRGAAPMRPACGLGLPASG